MSYASIAALLSGKRPIWLYRISLGQTEAFYTARAVDYIQADHDFFDRFDFFAEPDFFTRTWVASPIRHSRIRQTSAIGRAETKLVLPRADVFAQSLRDSIGAKTTLVRIWHGFLNDPDFELAQKFAGRVVSVAGALGTIALSCENRFTVMRRKSLAATMQRPCRHALYATGCGLAIADFEVSATASAWTSPDLTVAAAANEADGYYSGGVVSFGSHRQMILKHEGTNLRLLASLPSLEAEITANGSATISLAPGCNLTTSVCVSRFNNLDNYGGFPFMTDSPFDGRNPF